MSDLYQSGAFSPLHRLKADNLPRIESEVTTFCSHRPIALFLPALYAKFGGSSMPLIREGLCKVDYLHEIVIALGRTNETQFRDAKRFCTNMDPNVRVIWNDGPRVKALFQTLETNGRHSGLEGKGRACWLSYGYLAADRFISENGGPVFITRDYFPCSIDSRTVHDGYSAISVGAPYTTLTSLLNKVSRTLRIPVRAFHHMLPRQIAAETALPYSKAGMAQIREYDEPFTFSRAIAPDIARFLNAIKVTGLRWTRGGRFHHIFGQAGKGRAVSLLLPP